MRAQPVSAFLALAFALFGALPCRADTKAPVFAVSGPCYTVLATGSLGPEQPQSGSTAESAARFRGDLDGDGTPDRAVYLFPDLPGQDVAGEYHFFVMRGACGYWVGGFVSMEPEELAVGDKPIRGLRPLIATHRTTGGSESAQLQFTGQVYRPMLSRLCGRDGDCSWHPAGSREPLVRRPNLPHSQAAPVGTDAITLLFATLKPRGFVDRSPDSLSRGPLVVARRGSSLDFAEVTLPAPLTRECPKGGDTTRIDCGPLGRLAEIAEAIGGCTPLVFVGEIASVYCRDGLLLQTSLAERPSRVVLRGGAGELGEPTCDFFPHAGTVPITPGKSYCIFLDRVTSQTRERLSIAENCPKRDEGGLRIRQCSGVRFVFSQPQNTLLRLEFSPPATPPANP